MEEKTLDQIVDEWLTKARREGWVIVLPNGTVAVTLDGIRDLTRLRMSQ